MRTQQISVHSAHTISLGIKHGSNLFIQNTENGLLLSPQKTSLAVICQTEGNLPGSTAFCKPGMTLITNSKRFWWLWAGSEQGHFELSTVHQRRQDLKTFFGISHWPLTLFYTLIQVQLHNFTVCTSVQVRNQVTRYPCSSKRRQTGSTVWVD